MDNEWKINLSSERELRDIYLSKGKVDFANSVLHTESKYEGKIIYLLTLCELKFLKKYLPNFKLITILGEELEAKNCSEDTRFDYVLCGQTKSLHKMIEFGEL